MACRLTAALTLMAFIAACTTPRAVRLDTGEGPPLEYQPRTWNRAVEVSAADFEEALGELVLNEPLVIRPAGQGWLVRTSSPRVSEQATTGYWVGKALGAPVGPASRERSACRCWMT
jgi:hypothetical protein